MISSSKLVVFLVVCVFCCVTFMSSKSYAMALPIQKVTSETGIEAWLIEDNTLPVISMSFAFIGAGTSQDPEEKPGVARLVSNMLDEGAGDMDSEAFQRSLLNNSITLRYSASRDHFYGTLKTVTHKQDIAFDLLRTSLLKPRFDREPLQRMKNSNSARIRNALSNPDWVTSRIMHAEIYRGHPYARNSGGSLSSLQQITTDDLRAFHKNKLARDNLKIAVSGDISPEALKKIMDNVFAALPAKSALSPIADKAIETDTQKGFIYRYDIPQTNIRIAFNGYDKSDAHYHIYEVLNYITGGAGFGSRLMDVLRERNGLTYGVYSYNYALDAAPAYIISFSTNNNDIEQALALLNNTLEGIMVSGISESELDDAISYLTGSVALDMTSTGAIASVLLGLQIDNRPDTYYEQRDKALRSVTVEDVQEAAQKLFKQPRMVFLVGKPEIMQENYTTIEALEDVY